MSVDKKKGQFTFRITAALFALSAVVELLSISSEILLFGEIRGGAIAGIYHLVYVALFAGLGVGLWRGEKWGYVLVFVTTTIYTLDKLQFLLGRHALETFLANQMAGYEGTLQLQGIDMASVLQAIVLMGVVVTLCWWGFALYTYWRRDYFTNSGA